MATYAAADIDARRHAQVDFASIEESSGPLSARLPSGSQFSEDEAPISLIDFVDLLKVSCAPGCTEYSSLGQAKAGCGVIALEMHFHIIS